MEKILLRILEPVLLALLKKVVALVVEKIEVRTGKLENPLLEQIVDELNRTQTLDRTKEITACLMRGECQIPALKTTPEQLPNMANSEELKNG